MPDAPDWLNTYGRTGLVAENSQFAIEAGSGLVTLAAAEAGRTHVLTSFSVDTTVEGPGSYAGIRSLVLVSLRSLSQGVRTRLVATPANPSPFRSWPPGAFLWPVGEAITFQAVTEAGGGMTQVFVGIGYYTQGP